MLTAAQFYDASHHGNPFGKKGPLYGAAGHRGDDTNGWPRGTAIPSFAAGTVVRAERQVGLGWVVTIYCDRIPYYNRAGWVSWCHEQAASVAVGKRVELGAYVGPLGNTGTLSLGPHVHVVVSFTSSNPASGSVVDPRPAINAGIVQMAGGGASPLLDPKESDMELIYMLTSDAPKSGAKVGELYSEEYRGAPLVPVFPFVYQARAMVLKAQGFDDIGQPNSFRYPVSGADFDKIAVPQGIVRSYGTGGGGSGSGDAAVLSALSELTAAVNRLNPPG